MENEKDKKRKITCEAREKMLHILTNCVSLERINLSRFINDIHKSFHEYAKRTRHRFW
jgi:hypothetical protein